MKEIKFAEQLQEHLEKHNMSHAQLAGLVDVLPSTITGYCTGKIEPTRIPLIKICRVFGVTLDLLVFGEE